jgi:hypothetical protein
MSVWVCEIHCRQLSTITKSRKGDNPMAAKNGHGSEDGTFCFARNTIGVIMLRVSAAHQVAIDFRDQILATNQLGKRFVKHYATHQGELGRVVRKDPALIADSFDAWAAVVPFVQGMLAATSKTGGQEPKETIRFSRRDHAGWLALINRFRAGSSNKAFLKILDELEPELGRYVGLTADKALETFQSS